jgi:hypothetical protein
MTSFLKGENSLTTIASRVSISNPWEHEAPNLDKSQIDQLSTARRFRPGRQRWRVFISGLPGLLLTTLLCISLYVVYYVYNKKSFLRKRDQLSYNWLSMTLYLVISMSLSGAFKTFAKSYRWHLLSTRYIGLEEFDMVLGCESLITSTRLLWKGKTRGRLIPSRIQLYCGIFLLLNLGLQLAVSGLGLVVSPEPSSKGIDRSGKCVTPPESMEQGTDNY